MLFINTLFGLLIAHAVTDYALQSDNMAQWKHPDAFIPPAAGHWSWWMTAHALVNALGVALVTGRIELAYAEAGLHWLLDYGKCRGWLTANMDQTGHLLSKIVWAWITTRGMG